MPSRPDPLLWWRAAMVSAMTFLVGAVAHVSAGGLLPSWFALAAMMAIGTTISGVVLSRPASTARIVGLVVLGQTACHALLSVTAGHGGRSDGHGSGAATSSAIGAGGLPVSDGGRTGSLHDHYESMVASGSGGSALSIPDPTAVLDHLPMFVAHSLVAVVVGLWLAAGERALLTLLSLAVSVLVAVLAWPTQVPVATARVRTLPRRAHALPSLARVSRSVVRRGPPALLAA